MTPTNLKDMSPTKDNPTKDNLQSAVMTPDKRQSNKSKKYSSQENAFYFQQGPQYVELRCSCGVEKSFQAVNESIDSE